VLAESRSSLPSLIALRQANKKARAVEPELLSSHANAKWEASPSGSWPGFSQAGRRSRARGATVKLVRHRRGRGELNCRPRCPSRY
jgi:hypothetical protein